MTDSRSELLTLTNADPKFYKLIGPYLGRREVHRAIGSAVYDDDDKMWLVIVTGRKVEGFLAFRPQRGAIKAESCYIPRRLADGTEDTAVRMALLHKLVEVTTPTPITAMVPKSVVSVYTDVGFAELTAKSTRNFAHLVKAAS